MQTMHRGQRRPIGGGIVEAAKGLVDAVLAPIGIATKKSREVDIWLGHVQSLDDDGIERLLPLVEGDEALDTLRKLIGMCPTLANPARAMDAIRLPRDECIKEIYKLRTVALFLEEGGQESVITLEKWCQRHLCELATGDAEFAEWLVTWCGAMIARFNPTMADVLQRVMDVTSGEGDGDAL